jgi:hypothetical protein
MELIFTLEVQNTNQLIILKCLREECFKSKDLNWPFGYGQDVDQRNFYIIHRIDFII